MAGVTSKFVSAALTNEVLCSLKSSMSQGFGLLQRWEEEGNQLVWALLGGPGQALVPGILTGTQQE